MRLSGLWRDADFLRLWGAHTAAVFGTLMGALNLTAILVLDANAGQMALLTTVGAVPAFAFGLVAGVWVDRMRRRPVLVIAELGRALSMGSIPVVHLLGALHMEHLYAVAFLNGTLQIFFMVAHQSYVPSAVGRANLVEANSKIAATESVVEVTAFSVSGWIAQLVSAVAAATVNSATFLVSGLLLLTIRKQEVGPLTQGPRGNIRSELFQGVRFVWKIPVLRAVTVGESFMGFADGAIGSMITLFAISEVGFAPGPLGLIYATGGISAFVGAVYAGRLTRRFGIGPVMAWAFVLTGLVTFLIPLAPVPIWLAAVFFLLPQLLGDGGLTAYDINEISLRQAITPDNVRGRVNSAIAFVGHGTFLLGAVTAGIVAEAASLRWALATGATALLLAGVTLLFSPVRKVRETPAEVPAQA
jgi:MFS family permease